jgi:DNA primase large subunit
MSSEAIVDVWGDTADVFQKYNIPLTKQTLETLVENELLKSLLQELNSVVGSSTATCIEGG